MNEKAALHTIFGAGQIGLGLAQSLLAKGLRVRLVRRSPAGQGQPNLEWAIGDATDLVFARAACRGASVVYNCTNPAAYHRWAELLPPLARSIRKAAAHEDARLVVLDNVYMYGPKHQGELRENTPMEPTSDKGKLRKMLSEELFEAHARGEVRATSGRASDYFGLQAVNSVVSNPRNLQRIAAGKRVEVLGDPDRLHSYSYIPDVVEGLTTLGLHPEADGRAWHLPVSFQGSTREFLQGFASCFGHEVVKVRAIPSWLVRSAGVFVPTARALAEMMDQWTADFVVRDEDFCEHFGVVATPSPQAIEATMRALRSESRAA